MIPVVSIYVGGVLTLLMAVFHTRFYRLFHWKADFEKITIVNARIIYTVHLALLFLFFIIVVKILPSPMPKELSQSFGLAAGLNLLFSIFWLWRLIWQLAYFRSAKGQKASPIGILLIIVFALLFVSYLIPLSYRFIQ